MAKYHYLVVGAGLFGSAFAQRAAEKGKRCLVIDRRKHLAGNAHCEIIEGIQVHQYGPHIFHTQDHEVWEYVNRFARFNSYVHSPVLVRKEGLYNSPLNMNTFFQMWGVRTPVEAQKVIQRQSEAEHIEEPKNLEEALLKQFGRDLYNKFLKDYIEKQWGQSCRNLPVSAAQVKPPQFTFDSHYFPDLYQGIPREGYDVMVKRMLADCEVMLNTEYLAFGRANVGIAEKTIFTGMIDEFFSFKLGVLDYRTITYQTAILDIPNWQGAAVMSYMEPDVPFTRVIEHKHFQFGQQPKTVVTTEYPTRWNSTMEPYFPVNDERNQQLYNAYRALAVAQPDIIFCGRLGSYHYYNMDEAIRAALALADQVAG